MKLKWQDIVSLVVTLILMYVAYVSYADLPDRIPSHYNGRGEADAWSGKGFIWFVALFAGGIYLVLRLVTFFVKSDETKARNWTVDQRIKIQELSVEMVLNLGVAVVFYFAYMMYRTIYLAYHPETNGNHWQMPTFMVAFLAILIYYIYQISKIASNKTK